MRYIVVDLEMHPLPNKYKFEKTICKNETIEIGAVMLDSGLRLQTGRIPCLLRIRCQ